MSWIYWYSLLSKLQSIYLAHAQALQRHRLPRSYRNKTRQVSVKITLDVLLTCQASFSVDIHIDSAMQFPL